MALSADRNTEMKDGGLVVVPVAANTKCFAGGIAVANATGYAAPGTTATGLTYLGRFEMTVDNTSGAAGAQNISVRRGKAFKWKNSGTDAVTQAELGKTCYIQDDETVAKTDGTGTRSAAGKVVGIDSSGVWVQ
jgi:hypothetical protein